MIGRVWTLARATIEDAARRRLPYVVIFFAFVMALLIPELPSYGAGVVEALFVEVSLSLIFAAALVVTIVLVSTKVTSDIERRAVYAVLSKPVSRAEYLVGTWLGIFLTLGWVVAGFTIACQVAGLVNYHDPTWRLWQGSMAIWMEMGVLAAVGVLFSTRTGPVVVTLAMLVDLFVGHARESVVSPESGLAYHLYPSLDPFNVISPVAHGGGVGAGEFVAMAVTFVAYSAILLLLASLLFRGRDL